MIRHRNLVDVIKTFSNEKGDEQAYIFEPARGGSPVILTYAELYRHSVNIANLLVKFGLRNKVVLLIYPPGLEFVKAFFGCLRAGVTPIPMYVPPGNVPDRRLKSIVSAIDISAVMTVRSSSRQVTPQIEKLYPNKSLEVIFSDEIRGASENELDLEVDMDIPALIQFTSGSTSSPKGVVVSHSNLIENLEMMKSAFGRHGNLKGGETLVSWLPFYHDMGLVCGLIFPIYLGGKSVSMSPTEFLHNPVKWLQLASKYRAEITGAPNFAYDYVESRVPDDQLVDVELGRLKVTFNGAEMIRPATMKKFVDRFSSYGFKSESLFYCYGMAEATLFISGRSGKDSICDEIFDGNVLANVGMGESSSDIIVVSEEGEELKEGEIGEVWVSGPHVAKQYINNEGASIEAFGARLSDGADGKNYLKTGDLGFISDNGLHIVGRIKNLIVVNGKNYYGEEIEGFVSSCSPRFAGAAGCILQECEGSQMSKITFIQEIDRKQLDLISSSLEEIEDEVFKVSRSILREFKLSIHRFVLLGRKRLPRTSSGKIDRSGALDWLQSNSIDSVLDVETN